MNIFEQFSLAREISFKEGEILLDKQKIVLFPVQFLAQWSQWSNKNPELAKELYESMKAGTLKFAGTLGEDWKLSYKGFLDRWVKYCSFGGLGEVTYQLIDADGKFGFFKTKGLPIHEYLKSKGVKEVTDVLFEGLVAGAGSGTFKTDLDVIETECICSGAAACVFHWGPRQHLREKFPELAAKRFGEPK